MNRSEPQVVMRRARHDDLAAIVGLLADDALGATRERFRTPLPAGYLRAFEAIDSDSNNELLVACGGTAVLGVLQVTFIPYLTYEGSWRALLEGVRVHRQWRGRGLGEQIVRAAIERARTRGCRIVQLTTDKSRRDAQRFYERLGFVASHEGLKLHLR